MGDDRKEMLRRFARGEMTVADVKKLMTNSALIDDLMRAQEAGELRPRFSSNSLEERAAHEFEHLHATAIRQLRLAEEFLCPVRWAALDDIAESLDPDALPEDFFRRLLLLRRRIKAAGKKRPRTLERDRNIRFSWGALRGNSIYRQWLMSKGKAPNASEAIATLVREIGTGAKTIEAVKKGAYERISSDAPAEEFIRLKQAMERRFPRKSWPSSRY